jgi:hypothetical protein
MKKLPFIILLFVMIAACSKDDNNKKQITCSGNCDDVTVQVSGESGAATTTSNCQFTYGNDGNLATKTCTGTRTYEKSGNTYHYSLSINYSTCKYKITVQDVGSCGN